MDAGAASSFNENYGVIPWPPCPQGGYLFCTWHMDFTIHIFVY